MGFVDREELKYLICPDCGGRIYSDEEVLTARGTRSYCPECAREHKREANRAYLKKCREAWKESMQKKFGIEKKKEADGFALNRPKCVYCSFARLVASAKENGSRSIWMCMSANGTCMRDEFKAKGELV